MKIGIVLGSIREGRRSDRPAWYIADLLRSNGHAVDFLDLKELDLSLYNGSEEQKHTPQAQRLLEFVQGSQGFVFVFPEYNHNVAPPMLNALNYLENREFMHKPVGLVCPSVGIGGARALFIGRGGFPTQGAVIVPTVVNIPEVEQVFPDHTQCTNLKTRDFIDTMLREVLHYATVLEGAREACGEGGAILAANVHVA